MIYKGFKDLQLSWLGMGVMRLPVTDGRIDEKKADELIECAYEQGINYFDTAYFYHSGDSERFIGKSLKRFPRETWYLADKMPGNVMRKTNGALEIGSFGHGSRPISGPGDIFEEQLERCGVEYFDFYLLHNVSEVTYKLYTDREAGIISYLLEQKKAGRIRHLGFSAHARAETIDKFLSEYDCFEFAQIQLNYLDWDIQQAGKKYDVLTGRGIPVIAMEPCRGGKLANPGVNAEAILKAAGPDASYASWAFRFLQSLPNVQIALSGMTTMEQLKENIALFSKNDPVCEREAEALRGAVRAMAELVPCTACRYCCDGCPQKLDIPMLLSLYNEAGYDYSWSVNALLRGLSEEEKPAACVACGACTKVCPQGIDIPGAMERFGKILAAKS